MRCILSLSGGPADGNVNSALVLWLSQGRSPVPHLMQHLLQTPVFFPVQKFNRLEDYLPIQVCRVYREELGMAHEHLFDWQVS